MGSPQIEYHWKKDGKRVSEQKKLDLHLDHVDKFGNYSCFGKNDVGIRQVYFALEQSKSGMSNVVFLNLFKLLL